MSARTRNDSDPVTASPKGEIPVTSDLARDILAFDEALDALDAG